MLNLILAMLPAIVPNQQYYKINNEPSTNQFIYQSDVIKTDSGIVTAYSYLEDERISPTHFEYRLTFSEGNFAFSFDIDRLSYTSNNQTIYTAQLQVTSEDELNSNLYLTNLKIGDYLLPNVYFKGQQRVVYDDDNYYVENSDLSRLSDISFDIAILPSFLYDTNDIYNEGYDSGYRYGYDSGFLEGRQEGYQEGYQYGTSQDQTALTIFTGIIDVGILPVNIFLAMMNFEVFGINIGGLVSSLMTIAIALILWRIIMGGNHK